MSALHVVPDTGPRPGNEVLDAVAAFVSRFSAFPDAHCAPTLALWYAHTHAAESFYVTPRLILDSAEPGSGKTRVLEVGQFLARGSVMTFSVSPSALFRMLGVEPMTLLFDEVDAIFNPKNATNYEDLRALLNSGYKRGAVVLRCVGDAAKMKVERFPVYAPVALAGIAGNMPATITTRAITVHMRRRAPSEQVEPFRERKVAAEAEPLHDDLAAWAGAVAESLADAEPEMPDGVTDRPAEIWEPLLAVADAAGGHWPDTARAACAHFVNNAAGDATSLGIRLLSDLRELFTRHDTGRLSTAFIVTTLNEMDEAPWADLGGKPLDARRLSRLLIRYGIKPGTYRFENGQAKGYDITGEAGLADAFERWLTPDPADPPGYSRTSRTKGNTAGQSGTASEVGTDASVPPDGPGTDAAVPADQPYRP